MRSLAAVCCLALLSGIPASAHADYDWDLIYSVDVPFQDGMLWPDRIVVHFEADAVPTVSLGKDGGVVTEQLPLNELNQRFGVRALAPLFDPVTGPRKAHQPLERDLVFTVDFDPVHSLKSVADAYRGLSGVTRVEPVGVHAMHAQVPNDPSLQSWLRAPVVGGKDIGAVPGWYHQLGDPNVIIAIADSGVDWQHPDLGGTGPDYIDGAIWINDVEWNGTPGVDDDSNGQVDDFRGWDFVTGVLGEQNPPQDTFTADNDPMDYDGHGTAAAGCAAAITNNGIGVAGASYGCSIMALKIGWLPPGATLGVVRMDYAAQAMDYARINGARVFNASWGNSSSGGFGTATSLAINAGVVVVTSAGNGNANSPDYLGQRSDTLAVAAVDSDDLKASFSDYGSWVDISAPGVSVFTTDYDRFTSSHVYSSVSGTSFSSPIVAGVAGIMASADPGGSAADIRAAVVAAHEDIDALNPGFAGLLGSGRVDIARGFSNPYWRMPDQVDTWLDAFNAADPGDEIRVVGGTTLNEQLALDSSTPSVSILGGYDASFTTRDPINNPSVIDNPAAGPSLQVVGTDNLTTVDGFEITGGLAQLSTSPVSGYYGGGVVVRSGSTVNLVNLRVTGNSAGNGSNQVSGGGGIAVLGASPTLTDVEVTNNDATKGAGIYVFEGSPVFNNVNVHNNIGQTPTGDSPAGVGVYVVDTGGTSKRADVVTFNGGSISDHSSTGPGGGLYATNSTVSVTGTTIANNDTSEDGGGIYVTGGSYTGVDNSVMGNAINLPNSRSGGGLYATGGAVLSIDGSRYESNSSTFAGGGIYTNVPDPSITNATVVKNTATLLGSGMYINVPTTFSLTQSTIADNTGASAGSNGVYVQGGTATVTGNILAFNGGGGVSLADGFHCAGGTATFSCNLVFGNDAGNYGGCPDPTGSNGNAVGDPQFCDAPGGDYDISDSSPAATAHSGGCGDIGAGAVSCVATAIGEDLRPRELTLAQNAPNPFNPRTTIHFSLPGSGRARVLVYDLRGREVATLVDEALSAGPHTVTWDGRDDGGRTVASGSYLYSVEQNGRRQTRKLQLIK